MKSFDPTNKTDRILQAAFNCVKQYGFKRTSMADIALASDISRSALYLVFKDKTDIFRSVTEKIHNQTLADAKSELAKNLPLKIRIANATTARMTPLYALVYDTAHGTEIFDMSKSISADINAEADDRFLRMLTGELQSGLKSGQISGGPDNLAARELAQLFIASAMGLKSFAFSAQDYETLLTKSVATFFTGLSPK
ncbi:MAG: TetR/AcrR family transcriptional regulator [Robiginitomaculum sp.]|nr:TetR/AcrR family transcriptional regulator [Robiginitomaculum sp.]